MKKLIFKGAGVAVVTPFGRDNKVNYTKLGELIDWQIENGTDAIIACGTTGESPTLNDEEHIKVIEFAVKHTAGRVPVVAGAGSNDTRYAVMLAQEANRAGADGLLVVTPYYNKTSQRGLVAHYNAIADSTDLPVIIYNVPSRTGINIAPATYKEMSLHPNISAVKEANGNISSVAQTRALCGDEIYIYSGNDDQIVPIMSLGGVGVISVLSNIMPRETHNITALYAQGKTSQSADLQIRLMKIIDLLFADVNPIPVKEALNLMGMEVGECRLPLLGVTNELKEKLRNELQVLGLVK